MANATLFSLGRSVLNRKSCLNHFSALFTVSRNTSFFKQLSLKKDHMENNYEYEVSKNPSEWHFVEQLLPLDTVPEPKLKPSYPSGWKPMSETSLQLPYFVERSKNHMLSVYLKLYDKGQGKITVVKKIHGDIWSLHDELKSEIEEKVGKKIASFVHEGNNVIHFKGDLVYYVEQWLLSKGF